MNGDRASFGGDDDGLEPDNGTGCMPLSMYEKPLYCTLLKD